MTAVKIVKVLGTSEESWQDATSEAVREASKTIDDIHGVEVEDQTAAVENGEITEYKTTVEVAFPVHDDERKSQGDQQSQGEQQAQQGGQ